MKKSLKILILGLLTIGMATGCKINKRNGDSSGSDVSSSVPADSSADSSNDASSQDPDSSSDNSASSASRVDSTSDNPSSSSSGENYGSDSSSGNPFSSSDDGGPDSGEDSSFPGPSSSRPSSSDSSNEGEAPSSSSGNSSSSNPTPFGVSSIDADATNVKKEYVTGEALDLTGLVVTATYSDGSTRNVTDYTSDPANGTVFTEAGTKTVTISFGGQSDSFSVSVADGPKANWTAEEAALMANNLYGEVFPYTGSEDSTVEWDAESDTLYIEGGEFDVSDLAGYELELEELDYYCYDYDDENYDYYALEKGVVTDAGTRYVRVYISVDEGVFNLEAYDPYYYEFPAELVAEIVEYYYSSNVIAPAFEADYYQFDFWNNAIYCYTDSLTAEADYTKALNEAGWTLQPADEDGYLGAIAPDNRYMILYGYDAYYGDLDIYFGPVNFWNSELIEEFFAKYNGRGFDVPAFEAEGAYFTFSEGYYNEDYFELEMYEYMYATMTVYPVTSDDVDAYLGKLENNDWSVSGSDDSYSATVMVDSKNLGRIDIEYDDDYEEVEITIHFALEELITSEFPSAKIAAALGSKVTDTVPPYTGANNGFQFLSDSYGTAVVVYVDEGTETASVNAYIETLTDAHYTSAGTDYFGDPLFASPNDQIIVGVYSALSGQFTITFEANVEPEGFPSEDIAALLEELGVTTDANALPAVEGANEYEIDERSGYFYVRSEFGTSSAANSALTSYISALAAANFTEGGLDSDGDMNYDSPNKQFYVCPYVSGTKFVLFIVPGEFVPPANTWPASDIADLLGEGVTDVLPAFEGGDTYDAFEMEGNNIRVVIYCDDPVGAYSTYCGILVEAGYSFDYTDEYGYNYYVSPNEQLEVGPWGSSYYGCLFIDVEILNGGSVDEDVWPAATIANLLGDDVTDVLPAYTDTEYVEAYEGSYSDVQVAAYVGDNYDAAVAAYKKILTDADYEYSFTDDYGDVHYSSPNNQIDVCPWGDDEGWLVIDIDIIAGGTPSEIPEGWPSEDIAGLFQEAGFTNNLPQYNGTDFIGAVAYLDYDEIMIDVYLDEENEENWDDSIAAYAAQLNEANFEFSGMSQTGDYYYMSPDGDYGLDFGWSTVGMYICVWSAAW